MLSKYIYNSFESNLITSDTLRELLSQLNLFQCAKCSHCQSDLAIHKDNSKADGIRFSCKGCRKSFDIRKFTLFSTLRIKLKEILAIILYFSQSMPNEEIIRRTSVSRQSVCKVLRIVREKIFEYINDSTTTLGPENVVEIDETLIARRKYNRGRIVQQQWLFGAIERNSGNFILKTVSKRDSDTLGAIIRDFISSDSTVYSDQWPAYAKIFSENFSYCHATVNHSREFVNHINSQIHTQTIESLWSCLKRFLRARNLRNREKIEFYLAEFTFRKLNYELSPIQLFEKIINIVFNV